jgi:hypothetical protein
MKGFLTVSFTRVYKARPFSTLTYTGRCHSLSALSLWYFDPHPKFHQGFLYELQNPWSNLQPLIVSSSRYFQLFHGEATTPHTTIIHRQLSISQKGSKIVDFFTRHNTWKIQTKMRLLILWHGETSDGGMSRVWVVSQPPAIHYSTTNVCPFRHLWNGPLLESLQGVTG